MYLNGTIPLKFVTISYKTKLALNSQTNKTMLLRV